MVCVALSVSQLVFGKEKKRIYNLCAYAIVDHGVRMCDMCMLPASTGEEYQFAAPRVWYEVPTLWYPVVSYLTPLANEGHDVTWHSMVWWARPRHDN